MSVRQALIILNGAAIMVIIAVIVARVLSLRRNPEPHGPQNKTPFLPDEQLEGRKLERVLGWSLLFTVVIAIALPVYFLVEPDRQVLADRAFEDQSVERGAALFANDQSPDFDATVSLLCADCHGVEGQGGTAPFTLEPEDPSCPPDLEITAETAETMPQCLPVQVSWEAPPLDVALLRYPREQVSEIITYGRPGTPMPAWGVASGEGVLNEQAVDDLVNYIESLQITPDEAKERFTEELEGLRTEAAGAAAAQEEELAAAQEALAQVPPDASEQEVEDAQEAVSEAQLGVDAAATWSQEVAQASEGALLFQLQCARCHTKGWSYYDPLDPTAGPAPGPQGGGAFGPNLTAGAEQRQFPGAAGLEQQILFVAQGVAPNKAYGVRGISTGRMPHFNDTLTEEQIEAIVEYERGL